MINYISKIKKNIVSLLLMALCVNSLIACGKKTDNDNSTIYQIYYISENGQELISKEYAIDKMLTDETLERIVTMMSLYSEEDKVKAPLAMGATLLSSSIENDLAILNMDDNYYNLKNDNEVLIRAALVKTITQIPGVNSVKVLVNGKTLYDDNGNEIGEMKADDFWNDIDNTKENLLKEAP